MHLDERLIIVLIVIVFGITVFTFFDTAVLGYNYLFSSGTATIDLPPTAIPPLFTPPFSFSPTWAPSPTYTLKPTKIPTYTPTSTPTEAITPAPTFTDAPTPIAPSPTASIPPSPVPTGIKQGGIRHRGPALSVSQTDSVVIAENVLDSPVAIRISWDGADRWGTGDCPDFPQDCIINNWVLPGAYLRAQFKDHASAQLWAWGTHGRLVDSCSFNIKRKPTIVE